MPSRIQLAAAAGAIAASSLAYASPATVDLQELYKGPAYTGVGVDTSDGVASGSVYWNSITAGTAAATNASNGTALITPILFSDSVGAPNFYQPSTNTATATQVSNLLGQGVYGSSANFTLTGVPEGTYNLYMYTSCGGYDASQGGIYLGTQFTVSTELTSAETASATDTPTDTAFSSSPGGNYVVFAVDVGLDGTISGSYVVDPNDQSNQTEFNGLQLVSTPEPASLGILGVSTLGLLTRRRRS